jgi:predicted lipoprotein with Yx(FWY)xxD motif
MHIPRLRALATAAALATGALALTAVPASASALPAASKTAAAGPTRIIEQSTPFGEALAVGSGPFAGFSVYFITSDHDHKFGCTSVLLNIVPIGPIQCTGKSQNAEWPAVLTKGKPVAGAGVSAALLGRVFRKGVGSEVTYAGHPLYLFDQGPGQVSGEGFDEPGLPPWHGLWNLIGTNGLAVPWPGQLTTTVIKGKTVLAALYQTGAGFLAFPVYSYSRDSSRHSKCDTGACAREFPGVLTSGRPGVSNGLFGRGHVGTLWTATGTQVKWNGHPLYLYGSETIFAGGKIGPQGNGNGVVVNGGTFRLIHI